jgi:histidyl-tRNA synthetase
VELNPPRGTTDLLPPTSERILALEREAHRLSALFGYRPVGTPTFEHTELFARTSGEASDVVTKEMYTFEDKGGRSLTLRPEGTAPVVRAYLAHRQELPSPFKASYVQTYFRHGRPQAGRLREFRQFGIEAIGSPGPGVDVEVIVVGDRFLRERGLTSLTLLLNSIGDQVCRPAYREELVAFLEAHRDELCEDCRGRIRTNPLRTFDCKEEGCRRVMRDAPVITDHLCDPCAEHFAGVREGLAEEGVAYDVDPRLVRGLDYYTRTAFEFASGVLSPAQATVCGGGRYDGLAEVLGGPPTPGIGFGLGLERVLLAMGEEGVGLPASEGAAVFVVAIGGTAAAGRELVRGLRASGVPATSAFEDRPLKAQLRMADRSGARFAAILGEREIAEGAVTLRRLADGAQETVPIADVASRVGRTDP